MVPEGLVWCRANFLVPDNLFLFLYVFIKLHVIIFNKVLNNKFPITNPAVSSSLLAPESWCH